VADEKRQIILDLLARDKSGGATDSFARNLDKLGHTAEDTKRQVNSLDKEIEKHQLNLQGLAKAYAETDDKATRMDLSKAIRGSEAEIKKLTKGKGILEAMLPDEGTITKAGAGLGAKLMQGVQQAADGIAGGGPLVPVLVGAGIAAAPILGAILSGAVIGGAGLGGIVGGVMLASNDARVAKASVILGQTVMDSMRKSAETHFAQPLVDAIATVQTRFTKLAPDIDRIFSASASFLPGLVNGLSTFTEKISHGLADMVAGAGPVMQVISNGLANIGQAIGAMFHDFGDEGVNAATALNMAFNMVATTIRVVSATITGLTEAFGFLAKVGAFGGDMQRQYFAIEASAKLAAAQTKEAADATGEMSAASKASQDVIYGEVGALSDLAKALRAQTDPAFAFLDAQDKMAKSQKAATTALQKHGAQSPEYRKALREEALAALGLEDAAGKVASTADGRMTPALKNTLKAAGMTTPEIAAVGRQMDAARKKGEAFAKTYTAKTAVSGYTATMGQLNSMRQTLANIDGSHVDVYIQGHATGIAGLGGHALTGRAVGGPASRARPYIVGEEGPELFVPSMDGTVLTAQETRQLMSRGTGAGPGVAGGGAGTVVLDVRGADSDLIRLIRKWLRTGELSLA
jgi:hypothetical protein